MSAKASASGGHPAVPGPPGDGRDGRDGPPPAGRDGPPGDGQPHPGQGVGRPDPVVEPLPYDGVASVAVGTVVWLVALVVMLPFAGRLEAAGRLWWVATAAVGFGLGLLGLWIVLRRRARLGAPSPP